MTTATVGVLALQGDVREHRAVLALCGTRAVEVRLPGDLDAVDALVLPGGESTTMSLLLGTSGLLGPLRRRLDEGMPTLSTCAGLIVLSRRILDGRPDQVGLGVLDLAVRRNGHGRQGDSFEELVAMDGESEPVRGAFIRAPVIVEVGPAASVFLRCGGEPVGVRQGAHIGLTFHPEVLGEPRVHQLFLAGLTSGAANAAGSARAE